MRRGARRHSTLAWAVIVLACGWCSLLLAQVPSAAAPSTSAVGSASASASAAPVASAAPEAEADPRTRRLEALLAGNLEVDVDPQSLFDVSLSDSAAIAVEAARIRALLGAVVESAGAPSASAAPRRVPPRAPPAASASASASPVGSATAPVEPEPARWRARLELDRARLAFYSLPREQQEKLLGAHAARREAARPRETEAERRTREAEAEREQALEAARLARTEAARLVNEEMARLIGLRSAVATVRDRFAEEQEQIEGRRDVVLGWQRRVREAKGDDQAQADAVYDALRRSLRAAREELALALDDLRATTSRVPELGPDPLVDVPPDITTGEATELRREVERAIAAARSDEQALREEHARRLLGEVNDLNSERLGLLPFLTPALRRGITGFSPAGWDQAKAEVRHLGLIARYDRRLVTEWLRSLREGGPTGISPWSATVVGVPWLLLVVAFIVWRRRGPPFLALLEAKLADDDQAARRVTPSPLRRAVAFLAHVRRPLEWLTLFLVTWWLLPSGFRAQMETRLVASMIAWMLGASALVTVVDALAARSALSRGVENDPQGALRLRSLRLVARVSLVIILVLVLTTRLVGQGTIYRWVISTCWLASLPIFLILVQWWKKPVFERVDRVRKKTPLQAWVLTHQTGWKSFLAAMVGGVHLFVTGLVKTVRGWVAGFSLVRRAHAYLFRRELARLASARPEVRTQPLGEPALAALDPAQICETWLACPADAPLARLRARLREGHGGIIAVVGSRGLGKTCLLRQLSQDEPQNLWVDFREATGLAELEARIAGGEAARGPASKASLPRLVLLDEAQTLVQPVIGGLARLDSTLAAARALSSDRLWVLAFDAVLWPLIQRSRDGRRLFDEVVVLTPWTEDEVGELLWQRSAAAGFEPCFADLLEDLPPGADEIDRQEALAARRTGYVRMLWDHVDGNPGLALEAWRASLVEDTDGAVRVRALRVPDARLIDGLPEAAFFVLRAVLQLAPATAADVAAATRVTDQDVHGIFQLGFANGYLEERAGRVDVTWRWRHTLLTLLARRHLLVNS